MRSKKEAAEHAAAGTKTAGSPATPEVSENEQWAWMVDEDPAFYLSKSGTAPESTGG